MKRGDIKGTIQGWMSAHGVTPEEMALRMHMSPRSWFRRMQHPEALTVEELERLEKITRVTIADTSGAVWKPTGR